MGKIWLQHPMVQLSASFGDLIRGLRRLMLCREAPYYIRSPHALGKTRIASGAGQQDDSEFGPAKRSQVDKNLDRLGPPATVTSDWQRQPTNPSQKSHNPGNTALLCKSHTSSTNHRLYLLRDEDKNLQGTRKK